MIISNVRQADTDKMLHIKLQKGRIVQVSESPISNASGHQLTFDDAIIFPGLINSHDHLDFNLFPSLGDRHYSNYTEWGKHIHETYAAEIASVLKIPIALRESWGIYKNLLCGVTTVVNHGEKVGLREKLIRVFEDCQSLHSVQFEKKWRLKLNNPLMANLPVAIHVGEGIDALPHGEIDELIGWNLLNRKLIGIHGVAMSGFQADSFKALVWCPESNHFLLNATAQIDELKNHTSILFGSDSTLTGSWDIWQHIRLARETKMLTDLELYQSLTEKAADIWKLNCGRISIGFDADLVVAKRKKKSTGLDTFYSTTPEDILLIIQNGEIRLFGNELLDQLRDFDSKTFEKISIGSKIKYVQGKIIDLMEEIKSYKSDLNLPIQGATVSTA